MMPPESVTTALQPVARRSDYVESVRQLLGIISKHGDRGLSDSFYFGVQLALYVKIFLPACPFEIDTTLQYSAKPEARVIARQPIDHGAIEGLCGTLVPLKEEEERELDIIGRNFSIVTSNHNDHSSLFLGPGRFVNHDCNANAELSPTKGGMQVVATKYIPIEDEITINYGSGYFGKGNRDCLCRTCELLKRNGWAEKGERSGALDISTTKGLAPTRLRRLKVRDARTISTTCTECRRYSSECLRCERHLRLYGYRWPKTEAN
jgi:hypothetical protein